MKPTRPLAVDAVSVKRVFSGPAEDVVALDAVDLAVPVGAMHAVMGRSGSGKTTLLNLVGALDRPTAGAITVFGQRVDGLNGSAAARWRSRSLGFVFQAQALMASMTALENVELAMRIAGHSRLTSHDRSREALERVGLSDRLDHRPAQLSGGQRQRVAVARAIAPGNRLLLADEPTAGLDTSASADVFTLLRSLVDGSDLTVLMATHDPLTPDFVDSAVELRHGVLAEPV